MSRTSTSRIRYVGRPWSPDAVESAELARVILEALVGDFRANTASAGGNVEPDTAEAAETLAAAILGLELRQCDEILDILHEDPDAEPELSGKLLQLMTGVGKHVKQLKHARQMKDPVHRAVLALGPALQAKIRNIGSPVEIDAFMRRVANAQDEAEKELAPALPGEDLAAADPCAVDGERKKPAPAQKLKKVKK